MLLFELMGYAGGSVVDGGKSWSGVYKSTKHSVCSQRCECEDTDFNVCCYTVHCV